MKIDIIEINNFRLLKSFSIKLENVLSLVIGKNNTGKTSFLSLLNKFLKHNTNTFSFDDFNIQIQEKLKDIIDDKIKLEDNPICISLKMFITYDKSDNLENISNLFLDLSPSDNILVIEFKYGLEEDSLSQLKLDYETFQKEFDNKDIYDFLNRNHKSYFKLSKRVVDNYNEKLFKDLDDNQNQLNKIINFQYIGAKRDVVNVEGDKALSKLSYKFFKSTKSAKTTDISDLQKQLIKTDLLLNDTYEKIFKDIIKNVKKFSYSKKESQLQVRSNLEEINVLKENTSVVFEQEGHYLPEDYNGLGYMNLFSMIFSIHIILDSFKKKNSESEKPADINLLFIEEPEAHTHPQMQYVFIKNIKNLLSSEGEELNNLQTIISTHSSHITSQSDFNDIKYFLREKSNVIVKNISELQGKYGTRDIDKLNFQFLKQYLTLNRAELFFTDKLILIEGDTERILLPAMMQKIDLENIKSDGYTPLLSQNISITEVGAYSHIFEKFIDFLSIKTLIITDIDSVKPNASGQACPVNEGTHTSNASIKYFLNPKSLNNLTSLNFKDKVLAKKGDKWESNENGNLNIAYQVKENAYHARSFEDAFISINLDFLKNKRALFNSLKNINELEKTPTDYYNIANDCIKKKTNFASDILYFSGEMFSEWTIPQYIKEGLEWLLK